MLLIRQCNAQVLQLMPLRPSQTTWVMQAGLLECIFDGVFFFSFWKVEERREFQTSGQGARAAKVTFLLWVSPNKTLP